MDNTVTNVTHSEARRQVLFPRSSATNYCTTLADYCYHNTTDYCTDYTDYTVLQDPEF